MTRLLWSTARTMNQSKILLVLWEKEKLYSQVVSSSAKMPSRVPRSSEDSTKFPALPLRTVTPASNTKKHQYGTKYKKKVVPFHMGSAASRLPSRSLNWVQTEDSQCSAIISSKESDVPWSGWIVVSKEVCSPSTDGSIIKWEDVLHSAAVDDSSYPTSSPIAMVTAPDIHSDNRWYKNTKATNVALVNVWGWCEVFSDGTEETKFCRWFSNYKRGFDNAVIIAARSVRFGKQSCDDF